MMENKDDCLQEKESCLKSYANYKCKHWKALQKRKEKYTKSKQLYEILVGLVDQKIKWTINILYAS